MIKYREVKCPYCEKKYMWEATNGCVYYLNTSGVRVATMSKCPTCEEALAVFDNVLEAVPTVDMGKNHKVVREYGI